MFRSRAGDCLRGGMVLLLTHEDTMANFDPNAYAPYAQGMGRTMSAAQYDQGLRSYMLSIYNHMAIALAVSGLVAIGAFMLGTTTGASGRMALTPFGSEIWASPLKWVIMLAPLAFNSPRRSFQLRVLAFCTVAVAAAIVALFSPLFRGFIH